MPHPIYREVAFVQTRGIISENRYYARNICRMVRDLPSQPNFRKEY
ncbi:MAG: hypothetical protein ACTSWK_00310 [Promethearchaeota archaeon]